jgi:hypothetical protein
MEALMEVRKRVVDRALCELDLPTLAIPRCFGVEFEELEALMLGKRHVPLAYFKDKGWLTGTRGENSPQTRGVNLLYLTHPAEKSNERIVWKQEFLLRADPHLVLEVQHTLTGTIEETQCGVLLEEDGEHKLHFQYPFGAAQAATMSNKWTVVDVRPSNNSSLYVHIRSMGARTGWLATFADEQAAFPGTLVRIMPAHM